MFFDEETESLAADAGLEITLAFAELRHRLDSKIVTTQLADEAGVPSVPNVLGRAESYEELLALARRPDWATTWWCRPLTATPARPPSSSARRRLGQGRGRHAGQELKVMRRIDPRAVAVEASAHPPWHVVGPLMTDLTGYPELTPYRGGWCGNDIFPEALAPEHRERARELTRRLVDRLAQEGYRGLLRSTTWWMPPAASSTSASSTPGSAASAR